MANWEITDEHKKQMSAFMTDFWEMIKKSYERPDADDADEYHYWTTLVKWADALGKKYNCDPVISGIICGYLDGHSVASNSQRIEIKIKDT